MAKRSSSSSVVEAGATSLSLAAGATLQWNASNGVSHEARSHTLSEQQSFFRAKGPPVTESHLSPYWTISEIDLVAGFSPQTIAWEQEAARTTFSLAPALLANTQHSVLTGATGELMSLADALAVHFLRRYGTTLHPLSKIDGGLSPYKLQRTTAYIKAHLEQELSLATLTAVGETSPAHFSRLFKHATGLAPHQYVITCRMERAKHLLAKTNVSLSEIALLVGCTDHGHFSALFRAHVAQTPTAYRDEARK